MGHRDGRLERFEAFVLVCEFFGMTDVPQGCSGRQMLQSILTVPVPLFQPSICAQVKVYSQRSSGSLDPWQLCLNIHSHLADVGGFTVGFRERGRSCMVPDRFVKRSTHEEAMAHTSQRALHDVGRTSKWTIKQD